MKKNLLAVLLIVVVVSIAHSQTRTDTANKQSHVADFEQLNGIFRQVVGCSEKGECIRTMTAKQLGDLIINHPCRGKRKGMELLNFDDFMGFSKIFGNALGTYSETLGVNKSTKLWLFNDETNDSYIVADDSEGVVGVNTDVDAQEFANELAKLMNRSGKISIRDFLIYMLKFQ